MLLFETLKSSIFVYIDFLNSLILLGKLQFFKFECGSLLCNTPFGTERPVPNGEVWDLLIINLLKNHKTLTDIS